MEMKPRELADVVQEVEHISKVAPLPIDDKIKDLVIGLRRWGIATEMSCEGHASAIGPYPTVEISSGDCQDLVKIRILIIAWRDPLKNPWVFVPYWAFWTMRPKNTRRNNLQKNQAEAMDFGKFLQALEEVPERLLQKP